MLEEWCKIPLDRSDSQLQESFGEGHCCQKVKKSKKVHILFPTLHCKCGIQLYEMYHCV